MSRGFKVVSDRFKKFKDVDITLPKRSTSKSAGYDFVSNETVSIGPGDEYKFYTDVKAYMLNDEVLKLYVRSSIGIKKGLVLKNQTGIIDADYYQNVDNDGNIIICLINRTTVPVDILKGEKIAQGIFSKYLLADDDNVNAIRMGGVGSTN